MWQPPAPSSQNGIIQHYIISVLEAETMRQFQLTSTTTSIDAVGLHPYYTYSFTVTAVTVGQGPYSQAVSLQTLEDGEKISSAGIGLMSFSNYKPYSAPSGPPQSFRAIAISSTNIRLTWRAPLVEDQNGVISSYRITITEIDSGQVLHRMTSTGDSLIISSLRPHITYRCAIAAFTTASGPESLAEVTTPQKGIVTYFYSYIMHVSAWFHGVVIPQLQVEVREM